MRCVHCYVLVFGWIFGCSTTDTNSGLKNVCAHTYTIECPIFFFLIHRRNVMRTLYDCVVINVFLFLVLVSMFLLLTAGGIRYCPCTFYHFTFASMPPQQHQHLQNVYTNSYLAFAKTTFRILSHPLAFDECLHCVYKRISGI